MKKSIKLSLTLLATTLLFACSQTPKTSDISVGISKSELIDTMGEPDYIETNSSNILDDIEPGIKILVRAQEDMLQRDSSTYTSEEQRLFDKRKVILTEIQDILVALADGAELDRYDYLNEEIYFEGSDEVQNGDMEVYVLEGRVIHVHSSSNE